MKKRIVFFLLLSLLHGCILCAQNVPGGIYLSAADFTGNKLSFTPLQGSRYRLVLNEILYKPVLKIIIGRSVYRLTKDSVFGYCDKENAVYRFYEGNIYKIVNPDEAILMYSRNHSGGYKNLHTIISY